MRFFSVFAVGTVLLFTTPVLAAEQGLTTVFYPNKTKVVMPMSPTERAPAIDLKVKVKHKDDLTHVKVKYRDLVPAQLFGGDIVTYVVWAVSPDGSAQNLGSIGSDGKPRGRRILATPWRDFGLLITAEPIKTVERPGEYVMFFSAAPSSNKVTPIAINFDGLVDRSKFIKVERESITGMAYKKDRKRPVLVVQAEKAGELLQRFDAERAQPERYNEAMNALELTRETKSRKQREAAIRTVELAGQTLKALGRFVEEQEAEAMQARAALAEAAAGEKAAALSQTEGQLQDTQVRLAQAESDRQRLDRQKRAIEEQLQTALGSLAEGRATEDGFVISLSGGAFASGKSTLTTQAKYVVAKLSGLVLALPDMTLRIEGHTDNTGKPEKNLELSEARAQAVEKFLEENGVEPSRMRSAGYGGERPVTSNDTAEGRDKNRRVDIVLTDQSK